MNTNEIFGRDDRFIHIRRKVEKIAEAKKLTFAEALIFCLKGASTQKGECVMNGSKRPFCRPKGGSTSTQKLKHSNTQTLKHSK